MTDLAVGAPADGTADETAQVTGDVTSQTMLQTDEPVAEGLRPLSAGTTAPDFSLRDQNNEIVTLSSFRGRQAVLIVFYPFAFTGICTGELGRIEAHHGDFFSERVQTLTISADSPFSHKVFAQREGLDMPLLSDFWPHGAVASSFGVFNPVIGVANRGTFLVDTGGIIAFSECNEIGVGRDAGVWLEQIAALQ